MQVLMFKKHMAVKRRLKRAKAVPMKSEGFIAKGCGKVMPNRRKLTKIY
jgi:hypothetical protein